MIRSGGIPLVLVGDHARIVDKQQVKSRCFRKIPANKEFPVVAFELKDGSVFIE
jgi:hypothetical protein